MIIAISGMSGSGKNTVGKLVAEKLGMSTVEYTFKDYAREKGVDLMEFQKMARKDPRIDRRFDRMVVKAANRGNSVVTTWLGPWMVRRAKLRVWLDASEKARARRISGREGMGLSAALRHLKKRDMDNITRYMKLYRIDIRERGIFDMIINTERFSPEEIADMVAVAARSLGK